jgi:hypothetical protein
LDATSQNQYTRTTERYLELCSIAGLIEENAESVEKFLIYCKDPQEACRNKEELAFGVLLPKEPMAAKTLWTVLSHLKKFFVACQNCMICAENPHLNGLLQQWEKSEEITQAKVTLIYYCIIIIN